MMFLMLKVTLHGRRSYSHSGHLPEVTRQNSSEYKPSINFLGLYESLNGLHDQRERQHTDGDNIDEGSDGLCSMVAIRVLDGGLPASEDSSIDRNTVVESVRQFVHCVCHDCNAAHTHTPFKYIHPGTQKGPESRTRRVKRQSTFEFTCNVTCQDTDNHSFTAEWEVKGETPKIAKHPYRSFSYN